MSWYDPTRTQQKWLFKSPAFGCPWRSDMDSISSEDAVLETHFEAVLVFLSVPGRQGCEGWSMWIDVIFPQIAIAIGFLLPIGGGGRRTTLADWTWHQVPLQGAVDVVPLLGAILGCHCSVLYGWGVGCRPTLVVPLLGAIVVCYGGGGWRPTLGEWTWCHCRVPMAPYTAMAPRKNIQKICLQLLAVVTLFSTLMPQKLVLAMGSMLVYSSFLNFNNPNWSELCFSLRAQRNPTWYLSNFFDW